MRVGAMFIRIPGRDGSGILGGRGRIAPAQPFDDRQRSIERSIAGGQTSVTLFTPPGYATRIGTFVNSAFTHACVETPYQELRAPRRGVRLRTFAAAVGGCWPSLTTRTNKWSVPASMHV